MAVRLYFVPKIGTGIGLDQLRPKYIYGAGLLWGGQPNGREDASFLVAADVTTAQHTALAANADVVVIPASLDAQIGASALASVKQVLEDRHTPADWVLATHTYRDVLRACLKLRYIINRFEFRYVRAFFESGITLDTRMNQLTATQRQRLTDTSDALGLNRSSITNTTTIRQALRVLFQQIPEQRLLSEVF